VVDAGPWDIVLVDEAHHARRRGSKPTDTPNSLLMLLQEMKRRRLWKALYLASATPMQMYPHEAWDLVELFGLPGTWGKSAAWFEQYYAQLREDGRTRDWALLARMLRDYLDDPAAERDELLIAQARKELGFVGSMFVERLHEHGVTDAQRELLTDEQITLADEWLRRHTPMRDRVFRTTRQTLRAYQDAGILRPDVVIPRREIADRFIEMSRDEWLLYKRIDTYIRRHYNAYKGKATIQALGFIMTVYRRRLTSSFHAIRCSLQRRLDVLQDGKTLAEMLDADDAWTLEDATLFDADDLDVSADLLAEEMDELRDFLTHLGERLTTDTKMRQLEIDIRDALESRYDSVVVFTQYTDTMDYIRDQLAQTYGRIACYSGRGGELYDPGTRAWKLVNKSELKRLFREGDQVKILIGTDSMSEGLNLQSAGRLINFDVPWNFIRVEQRIGRIDRIGGHPVVQISNYFYRDTVEEGIYTGIEEDFDWFTQIVGDAQPVLAAVEQALTAAAMTAPDDDRDAVVEAQIKDLRTQIHAARERAVKLSDLSNTEVEPPPVLSATADLTRLHDVLTSNPLTRKRFRPIVERPGVYELDLSDQSPAPVSFIYKSAGPLGADANEANSRLLVTFDRSVLDQADDELLLLTYGVPQLDSLLAAVGIIYGKDTLSEAASEATA
jgi:hypothetical protein